MPPAAQPRMTHACSSPGWMVQNLINYSSIGATARCNPGPQGISGRGPPSPPPFPLALKLALPPAQKCQMAHSTSIRASRHPCLRSQRSAAEAVAYKLNSLIHFGAPENRSHLVGIARGNSPCGGLVQPRGAYAEPRGGPQLCNPIEGGFY